MHILNHLFKVFFVLLFFSPIKLFSQKLNNIQVLKEKTQRIEDRTSDEAKLLERFLLKADSIVKINYWPRVTNKKLTAISDDIHDYVSMATYYWPNPNTKNSLPYIGIDGKPNPEVVKINNYSNLVHISKRIKALGLAYFYTKDEKYVKSAASLINVFFLRNDTKMNPNFNHAQFIKGENTGRIEGIIEARFFVDLLQGIELIKSSNFFPNEYYLGLKMWFKSFLQWMENSKIGKQNYLLKNNIETSYHLQRIVYAAFIGEKNKVENIYSESLKPLLKKQFTIEGKQPLELKRKQPQQYSIANLKYWYDIIEVLSNIGVKFNESELNKIEKATLYLHSLNLDSVNIYHQKMLQSIILRDKSENVGIDNYISQSLLIKLGYDDIDYLILLLTH